MRIARIVLPGVPSSATRRVHDVTSGLYREVAGGNSFLLRVPPRNLLASVLPLSAIPVHPHSLAHAHLCLPVPRVTCARSFDFMEWFRRISSTHSILPTHHDIHRPSKHTAIQRGMIDLKVERRFKIVMFGNILNNGSDLPCNINLYGKSSGHSIFRQTEKILYNVCGMERPQYKGGG